MKNIATLVACLGLAASLAAAADKRDAAVAGEILKLNRPGTILVELSIGGDDGLKTGDIFVVSRRDKRIAEVKIAKCESNRSIANIVSVQEGESLQTHDRVASKR